MKTKLIVRPIATVAHLAVCCLLLFGLPQQAAAGGDPRILPANAYHAGMSLTEWQELWVFDALNGAPINGIPWINTADVPVRDVLMLAGNWGNNPRHVTVKAGTFIVINIQSVWGELYTDGSIDSTSWVPPWRSAFTFSETLDGSPLRLAPEDYYVPITYFDEPVYYAETSSYGSVAAVWFAAYGYIIKPLTPGVHTLTSHADDGFFGYSWTDTFIINVVR